MLKACEFKNLAQFQGRQLLPEEVFPADNPAAEGASSSQASPIIFIGENNTGKSAACEIIRRCCAGSISQSETNVYDPDKIAYAVCTFAVQNNAISDNEQKAFLDHVSPKLKQEFSKIAKSKLDIYSFYVIDRRDKNIQKHAKDFKRPLGKFYKVLYFKAECSEFVVGSECNRSLDGNSVKYFCNVLQNDIDKSIFEKLFKNDESGEIEEKLLKFILESQEPTGVESPGCDLQSDNETIYSHFLSKSIVFQFGHRGVGTLDSSMSVLMRLGSENYRAANDKAETFRKLFRKIGRESSFEKTFQEVTGSYGSKFDVDIKRKSADKVEEIYFQSSKNSSKIPLLKTPVGIYEAALVSLLINDPSIETLVLEEPNRTMDPSMTQRLFNKLIEKSKSKTIVVVTHSPELLKWDRRGNVFLFRRSVHDHNNHVILTPFKSGGEDMHVPGVLFDSYKFIMFSRRVLLVEGSNDKMFVDTLIEHHKNKLLADGKAKGNVIYELLAISVISTNSCGNMAQLEAFCNAVYIPCRALVDADVLYPAKGMKSRMYYDLQRYRDGAINVTEIEALLNFEMKDAIKEYKKDEPQESLTSYICEKMKEFVDKKKDNFNQADDLKEYLGKKRLEIFKLVQLKQWDPSNRIKHKRGENTTITKGTMSPDVVELLTKQINEVSANKTKSPAERHEAILSAAKEKGYFVWPSGNMEDVINDHREEPFLKTEWKQLNDDTLQKLVKKMYTSHEIQEFCTFLETFCSPTHKALQKRRKKRRKKKKVPTATLR